MRLALTAACSLIFLFAVLFPSSVISKAFSPCESSAVTNGGVLLVCPAGDGPTLADIGATISVTILYNGQPMYGWLGQDFWLDDNVSPNTLCHGANSCNADAMTDANGQTTISGSVAAGGYFGDGVFLILAAELVCCPPCDTPLPLILVSPDITGDLVVEAADFSLFATEYMKPGGGTDPRMDFDGDGMVSSTDFALFAMHYDHACQ